MIYWWRIRALPLTTSEQIGDISELRAGRLSDHRVALAVVLSAVGDMLDSWVLIG